MRTLGGLTCECALAAWRVAMGVAVMMERWGGRDEGWIARLMVDLADPSLVAVDEERSLLHTNLEKFIHAMNLRAAFIHAAQAK